MKNIPSDYAEIIGLPHFHAPSKPYMKNSERSAQFAPYKSLNGYYDLIDDTEDEVNEVVWEDINTD